MVNEEEIKDKAKAIMDEFLQKLEAAGDIEENYEIVRDAQQRKQFENDCDNDFWDCALKNAPSVSGRTLKMEKKKFHIQ